jgi:hypothetical protein
MTNEKAKIAGSIQTEEKVVLLHIMALNNGVLNTGEVTKRGGRRIKI